MLEIKSLGILLYFCSYLNSKNITFNVSLVLEFIQISIFLILRLRLLQITFFFFFIEHNSSLPVTIFKKNFRDTKDRL